MTIDSTDEPTRRLKSLSWSNFRSFRRADIEVRRITVLLGRNNSGKSSAHRPLTLLKQTMEIDSHLPGLYGRGPLVDCGGFYDCAFTVSAPIVFRIGLDEPLTLWRHREGETTDDHIDVGAFELQFAAGPPLNPFKLERFSVHSPTGTRLLERTIREDGSYDFHGLICKGNPPNSAFDRALRRAIAADQPNHFLFNSRNVFADAFRESRPTEADQKDSTVSQFSAKYIGLTGSVSDWMSNWLSRLTYLGPDRASPKRTYRLGEFFAPSTSDGREVPELLHRIMSGESGLTGLPVPDFKHKLNRYMRLVGLQAELESEQVGEDAFSIYLCEQGRKINLADSAFGFSQVLPLVARTLLSVPGDTLIVEQPEVHLNPAVQARLADLFVAAIGPSSTAIIETHSEHLVNRLRTLVASGELSAEDLAIYFVDRGRKESKLRRVHVDEFGALDVTWPAGFFGDSLREARALANAQRHRKEMMGEAHN